MASNSNEKKGRSYWETSEEQDFESSVYEGREEARANRYENLGEQEKLGIFLSEFLQRNGSMGNWGEAIEEAQVFQNDKVEEKKKEEMVKRKVAQVLEEIEKDLQRMKSQGKIEEEEELKEIKKKYQKFLKVLKKNRS